MQTIILTNFITGLAALSPASFNTSSGEFRWTPSCLDVGEYGVWFQAEDEHGAKSEKDEVKITVEKDVNHLCELSNIVPYWTKPMTFRHYALWRKDYLETTFNEMLLYGERWLDDCR